ncbi:MAG: hypothetical protein AB1861_03415 [Cyanobacteriota bacterium]
MTSIYTAHQSPLFAIFLFCLYFCFFCSLLPKRPKPAPIFKVPEVEAVPVKQQLPEELSIQTEEPAGKELEIILEKDVAPVEPEKEPLEDVWEETPEESEVVSEREISSVGATFKQLVNYCQIEKFPGRSRKEVKKNTGSLIRFIAQQRITRSQLEQLRSL